MLINKKLIIASIALMLSACADLQMVSEPGDVDYIEDDHAQFVSESDHKLAFSTNELKEIESWSADDAISELKDDALNIRSDAIKEEALSVGAQSALHVRTEFLRAMVDQYADQYDSIFNFGSLLMNQKRVMPPIISEINDVVLLDGDDVMRIAGRNYQIVKQAHFVSNPPTWRDYLLKGIFTMPQKSHRVLLPKNSEEKAIWVAYVRKGWELGTEQADEIMTTNMFELQRDWIGAIRYKILVLKDQVSEPYIADSTQDVSGNGQDMIISDRLLRITVKPELSLNPENWQALPKLPSPLQPYGG